MDLKKKKKYKRPFSRWWGHLSAVGVGGIGVGLGWHKLGMEG